MCVCSLLAQFVPVKYLSCLVSSLHSKCTLLILFYMQALSICGIGCLGANSGPPYWTDFLLGSIGFTRINNCIINCIRPDVWNLINELPITVASDVLFVERMGSFIYPAVYPSVNLDQNSQASTGLLKRDHGSQI